MTGAPTLLVQLDDAAGSGAFPYDITPYVDMRVGWSLTRGRQDEFSEVEAGVARMTLNNRDARFTLGSPLYGIVVDQRIRITETFASGTPSVRFTGYVQDWPVTFSDPGAMNVPCALTIVDRQSRLARRKMTAALATEQRVDAPLWLYSLDEAAGATVALDSSGHHAPSLGTFGGGAAPTFGVETGTDQTGVKFSAGRYLARSGGTTQAGTYEVAAIVPEGYAGTQVILTAGSTSFPECYVEVAVNASAGVQATVHTIVGADPALSSSVSIADGQPHLLAVRLSGSTASLVVDGVQVDSGNITGSLAPFDYLRIGRTLSDVVVFGLAGYSGSVSVTRLAAHARQLAVTVSEATHTRVARLASYGNVASTDLALEPGIETALARQAVANAPLISAIQEVVDTEGGTFFVRGDGKLVMQNRQHRVRTATQTPTAALASDDTEHGDLQITTDKQYLQNTVTGSRVDGATQTATNPVSVAMYEQYPTDLPALLVTDDAKVLDRVNWQVNAYGNPLPRLNQVTIDLETQPSAAKVQALLALELGDRITISGLPSQSPIATADLIVEGFEEQQSTHTWTLSLNTVSADLFRAWVLGDATYGALGSTTRPHF